jgi:hypothetical protein
MQKIFNFASFEAKNFSPSFRFEAKLLHRSEAKNLKRKNRLEFCFASFRFEVKITKAKRSEAKRSEAKNLKRK